MKKDDLKDLLLFSLTDEISESERRLLEEEVIPEYSFSPSFGQKVLSAIEGTIETSVITRDIFMRWNNTFLKVALTGAAAIIILAVSLFLSQGSLSYDTLLGLDNSVDEGLVSFLTK